MTDIVAFLNARLDEDEAAAEAAIPKEWKGRRDIYLVGGAHRDQMRKDWVNATLANGFSEYVSDEATTAQVARHDPARVLREVEAKRRIVAAHKQVPTGYRPPDDYGCQVCAMGCCGDACMAGGVCDTVRIMAAVYADHQDYDPAWSVNAT